MGTEQSRGQFYAVCNDQLTTIKQTTAVTQRLADDLETIKPQSTTRKDDMVTQMGVFILIIAQTEADDRLIRPEQKEIEIEGTTYEMIQFINRGGFGEIHKAKVKNKDTIVAIKVMQNMPGLQEEIKNEINFLRLMKKIPINNHPIVEFFGSKVEKDGIYIAMELASCDLGTFWVNRRMVDKPEDLFIIGIIIALYVLRALAFLEKLNIIHGDIKPQNIVIITTADSFFVKLIDFATIEKMNTNRMQLTVGSNKPYTIFFASPEFLKRDSKNLISRKLHKKSDAWAAGVLFHLLFCGSLPWEDQQEYEKFCNDPNIKDIEIPDEGGYNLIIGLLLKKDPEERSSAKETIMQLKSHPAFGAIVDTLQTTFCPVDDVCSVVVPDDVRRGIAQMARSGHFTDATSLPSSKEPSTASGSRRSCRYGQDCYRKDASHRGEYSHPGNPDYPAVESSGTSSHGKRKCRYGEKCYRVDVDHRQKYAHPNNPNHDHSFTPTCRYGGACYNNEPEHRKSFKHPGGPVSGNPSKRTCRFGTACTKRADSEHMKTFLH